MLNLPNILTLTRIVLVPLLVALMWWPNWHTGYLFAFVLYALMAVTDYFDGYFARSSGAVSKLGQFLDPIADKIMVAAVILTLAAQGVLRGPYVGDAHVIAGLIILIREFMVSGLREFLAKQNVSAPVTRLAKWKTTAQILALGFLMGAPGFPGFPFAHEIGIILLWLAAILTVQTGSGYLINAVKHVTEKGKTANRTRS